MTDVNLLIHGRTYGVGCDDGQEKRVRELGQYIDKKVREIAGSGGVATEAHLMVLACLVLADEVFDLREGAQDMRAELTASARAIEALQRRPQQQAPVMAPTAKPEDMTKLQQQLFAANAQNKALARQIEDLEEQLTAPPSAQAAGAPVAVSPEIEAQMADTIARLTGRLEGIAKKLQAA
jgi:cell division protein ZapA (FtsZ GTPase activity inhibitor)